MFPLPRLLLLVLVLCVTNSHAENRVLFIGNSFTIGASASVAEIFDALAIAGGHDDPVTLMRADGGQGFEWHAANAPTQAAITSDTWTHVILQNYSTGPTHISANGIAEHFTFGTQLYDQIIANNSATQVILFETWSRAANHALITGESTASTFATTGEFQSELRTNYNALATTLTDDHPGNPAVIVGPAGDAWENAGALLAESDPNFTDLHGGDNYHGNDNGYFLAAAVFYAKIYAMSPEGLHSHSAVTSLNLSLTEDAEFLEMTAWDTCSSNVPLEFLSQPVSQSVEAGHPVSFAATVRGSAPTSVIWYRDDVVITGEETLSYRIASADLEQDGAQFKVEVTNSVGSITSEEATLNVVVDTAPPTLGNVESADGLNIQLSFSEAVVVPPSGGFTIINNGERIPIASTQSSPDGTVVTLTLATPISGSFVVAVSPASTDRSGNAFAADTIATAPTPDGDGMQLILIDAGGAGGSTGASDDPPNSWNNLSSAGISNTGTLPDLVLSDGASSSIGLEIVRRFNGSNNSGTTAAANYPASASGDSLFGNTELFSDNSDVFPAFRLAGLDPQLEYELSFYASRLGANDNRETVYTITGLETNTTTLDPAGNIDSTAVAGGLYPDASGDLLIELSPSPNNNNSYHFTYLGALSLRSGGAELGSVPEFYQLLVESGHAIIDWRGYGELETSGSLSGTWTPVTPIPTPPFIEKLAAPSRKFYRLRYEVE